MGYWLQDPQPGETFFALFFCLVNEQLKCDIPLFTLGLSYVGTSFPFFVVVFLSKMKIRKRELMRVDTNY